MTKKENKLINYRVFRDRDYIEREILLSGPQSLFPYVIALELNFTHVPRYTHMPKLICKELIMFYASYV